MDGPGTSRGYKRGRYDGDSGDNSNSPPPDYNMIRDGRVDLLSAFLRQNDESKGFVKTNLTPIEAVFLNYEDFSEPKFQNRYTFNKYNPDTGTVTLRVRTGGHIGFAKAAMIEAGVRKLSSAILINSLMSQKMVDDKVEYIDLTSPHLTSNMDNVGNAKVYLAPFTAFNVAMISPVDWRNQRINILPFERDAIRSSCIRIVGETVRCPTDEEIKSMNEGTFDLNCGVHLGRYLTCIDDPAIIAWFMLENMDIGFTVEQRDRHIKGRLRSMLLGVQATDDNISLIYENMNKAFVTEERRAEKADFIEILGLANIDYGLVPADWICDVQEVLIQSTHVMLDLNSKMASMAKTSKHGMRPVAYPDLRNKIDVMFLQRNFLSDGSQDDFYRSLQNAYLVNRVHFCYTDYSAKIGPTCSKQSVPFLAFGAMCHCYYRPYVTPLVSDYSTGEAKQALMFKCNFANIAAELFKWTLDK